MQTEADELRRARLILERLLELDFPGAPACRRQIKHAALERHATGCTIEIDRSRVPPAGFDGAMPDARLPVEGHGHGELWLLLDGREGYLDDLELINASRFPEPSTVKVARAY